MTIHQSGDVRGLRAVAIGVRLPLTRDHNQRVIHTKSPNPCRTTPTRRTKFARRGTWCLLHFLLEVVEAVVFLRRRTRSAHLVLASVPVLVCLLAACSGSTSGSSSSPVPSTASTTVAPTSPTASSSTATTSPTATAAMASYQAFWDAKVHSQATPTAKPPASLSTYGIDQALAQALATVALLRRNGVEMRGAPVHHATVTADATSGSQIVRITDCLDSSNWVPVFASSGKSALAPGQAPRVVVDSTVTTYDGRWVVKTSVAHRDQTC